MSLFEHVQLLLAHWRHLLIAATFPALVAGGLLAVLPRFDPAQVSSLARDQAHAEAEATHRHAVVAFQEQRQSLVDRQAKLDQESLALQARAEHTPEVMLPYWTALTVGVEQERLSVGRQLTALPPPRPPGPPTLAPLGSSPPRSSLALPSLRMVVLRAVLTAALAGGILLGWFPLLIRQWWQAELVKQRT